MKNPRRGSLACQPEYCSMGNILEHDQRMIRRLLKPDVSHAINPISWSTWQF
jgi:hypothetical protein